MKNTMIKKFTSAINDYRMLDGESGVLIGYSGGADSSALLSVLKKYCDERGIYLAALHVHHGIRDAEADRDAEFCRMQCQKLDVPFILESADIPALAKKSGRGLEETARAFRYEVFERIVRQNKRLSCVATAHNADDNAETVLFNLARGSGSTGLCGIPPIRISGGIKIVRPLLFSSKSEIMDYCCENGIEYIFDSTNSDTTYTRNYIRHEIMPLMAELNPAFLQKVGQMTSSVRADCAFIDRFADVFYSEHCKNGEIDAAVLANADVAVANRVIAKMFAQYSDGMLENVHREAIMTLVRSAAEGSSADVGGRVRAEIKNGRLRFTNEAHSVPSDFLYELKIGANRFENPDFAVMVIPPGGFSKDLQKDNETLKNIYKLSIHTMVNSDKINHALTVRKRRSGDSYVFGGMTRKLKKLFNDRALSADERQSIPIFCDSDGIIWVPGFRVADRVKPDGDTLELIYYYNGEKHYDK